MLIKVYMTMNIISTSMSTTMAEGYVPADITVGCKKRWEFLVSTIWVMQRCKAIILTTQLF